MDSPLLVAGQPAEAAAVNDDELAAEIATQWHTTSIEHDGEVVVGD